MSVHTAQIIAFPTAARVSAIKEAALAIKRLKTAEAESWWKHRAREMAASLIASGVPESNITDEVSAFQCAVFFELTRLYNDQEEQ